MQPLLNEKRAREALALRGKMTPPQLARRFGVAQGTIRELLSGQRWGHLHVADAVKAERAQPRDATATMFREISTSPHDARKETLVIVLAAIRRVSERLDLFTTDDVWRVLRLPKYLDGKIDPRVMGGAMKLAEADGICSSTDQYRKSERKVCRYRPVRVWRSEL